jgi:hypothetical protein
VPPRTTVINLNKISEASLLVQMGGGGPDRTTDSARIRKRHEFLLGFD